MYSGTEFHNKSGSIIGAHQKIDRVARKNLRLLGVNKDEFPPIKQILHFEGRNGPDGIKVKSPAQNEPWHYIDPFDDSDTLLVEQLDEHFISLVAALKSGDQVSAAFQAAWLAHTIVDGLTPAHHFPYEEAIEELRGGEGIDTRTSYKEKLIFPGKNSREKVLNNWKAWGVNGIMTRHFAFEMGFAMIVAPLRMNKGMPSQAELDLLREVGVRDYFLRTARHIALLDLYDRFYASGWNNKLVRDIRNELAPTMIRCVSTIWYAAYEEAAI